MFALTSIALVKQVMRFTMSPEAAGLLNAERPSWALSVDDHLKTIDGVEAISTFYFRGDASRCEIDVTIHAVPDHDDVPSFDLVVERISDRLSDVVADLAAFQRFTVAGDRDVDLVFSHSDFIVTQTPGQQTFDLHQIVDGELHKEQLAPDDVICEVLKELREEIVGRAYQVQSHDTRIDMFVERISRMRGRALKF
jgi:hypothetical protein